MTITSQAGSDTGAGVPGFDVLIEAPLAWPLNGDELAVTACNAIGTINSATGARRMPKLVRFCVRAGRPLMVLVGQGGGIYAAAERVEFDELTGIMQFRLLRPAELVRAMRQAPGADEGPREHGARPDD